MTGGFHCSKGDEVVFNYTKDGSCRHGIVEKQFTTNCGTELLLIRDSSCGDHYRSFHVQFVTDMVVAQA